MPNGMVLPCHRVVPQHCVHSRLEIATRQSPGLIILVTLKYDTLQVHDWVAPSENTDEVPLLAWLTTRWPTAVQAFCAAVAVHWPAMPLPHG